MEIRRTQSSQHIHTDSTLRAAKPKTELLREASLIDESTPKYSEYMNNQLDSLGSDSATPRPRFRSDREEVNGSIISPLLFPTQVVGYTGRTQSAGQGQAGLKILPPTKTISHTSILKNYSHTNIPSIGNNLKNLRVPKLSSPPKSPRNSRIQSIQLTSPKGTDTTLSKPSGIKGNDSGATYNLWVHDDKFSKHELVLNPEFFPNVKPKDLLLVRHPGPNDKSTSPFQRDATGSNKPQSELRISDDPLDHRLDPNCLRNTRRKSNEVGKELVIMASELDNETLSKQPMLQVSISNLIASAFGLKNRTSVLVEKVDPESVSADYIELSFKDQYLGRNDMWRLKSSLLNSCLYVGKKVTFAGCIRVQVKSIFIRDKEVSCGLITGDTKMIFRSESARCYLFVQLSREMWEFEEDGYLFGEKAMDGFLPDLMDKWKRLGANHIVSIILFTRIFYTPQEAEYIGADELEDGKMYKDYFKVVVDWETRNDWSVVINEIKREMVYFQRDIVQRYRKGFADIVGVNSLASEGNILEALNMALNGFDKHYVDRDLIRTGLCVMVISPGNGVFKVNKKLLRMTFERMNDNGISLDLVCLSKPPFHSVPLFQFTSKIPLSAVNGTSIKFDRLSAGTDGSRSFKVDPYDTRPSETRLEPRDLLFLDEDEYDGSRNVYFAIPHWIESSFYDSTKVSYRAQNQFVPRCKMPSLQAMGIHGESSSIYPIPYLNIHKFKGSYSSSLNPTFSKDLDLNTIAEKGNNIQAQEKEDSILKSGSTSSEKVIDAYDYQIEYELYDAQVFSGEDKKRLKLKQNHRPNSIKDMIGESRSEHKLSPNHSHGSDAQNRSLEDRIMIPLSELSSSMPMSRSAPRPSGFDLIKANHGDKPNPSQLSNLAPKPRDIYKATPDSTARPITISFKKQDHRNLHAFHSPPRNSWGDSHRSSPNSDTYRLFGKMSPKPISNRTLDQQVVLNPCISPKNLGKQTNPQGRWRHVFIKPNPKDTTKWTSLCVPACLPLTTDYFPTWDELFEFYQEYTYTVSPNDEGIAFTGDKDRQLGNASNLLNELISQRLAQGFQIVVCDPNDTSKPAKVVSGFHPEDSNKLFQSPRGLTAQPSMQPTFLSMGNHVHRLMYDPSGQNVEVKRYVRRIKHSTLPLQYNCMIYSKTSTQYHPRTITFSYPNLNTYNWNYLDHLISGYQEEMTEGLRFWRARFTLLPSATAPTQAQSNANLDDEETRLSCFSKFLEHFLKVSVTLEQDGSRAKIKSNQASPNQLNISYTTLNPSAYLRSEARCSKIVPPKRRGFHFIGSGEKFTKESKLNHIALAMQNSGTGIKLMDRRWHLIQFENVMVGNEMVDWFIRNFTDISTREEAVKLGNNLLKKGLFVHCRSCHPFMDGHYFYSFTKEYSNFSNPSKPSLTSSWFQKSRPTSMGISSGSDDKDNGDINPLDALGQPQSSIALSSSTAIDLDLSRKSSRQEIAYLHYDTIFNTDLCYHFQIHWLGCTSRLIDDLLQSWSRGAEKCGLRLIEAPVSQTPIISNENPFRSPLKISYTVLPPSIQDATHHLTVPGLAKAFPPDFFAVQLLKQFDFVLDMESDDRLNTPFSKPEFSYHKTKVERTQYMHRSGTVIVQALPDATGILFETNRLISTSSKLTNQNLPDMIKNNLKTLCSDPDQLAQLWNDTQNLLDSRQGIEKVLDDLTDDVLPLLAIQFPTEHSITPAVSLNRNSLLTPPNSHSPKPLVNTPKLYPQSPEPVSAAYFTMGSP